MREIESVKARMGGEPTFKNRRLTIGNMLTSLAHGTPLQAFCEDYEIDIEHCKAALKDIADNLYDWMRPKQVYELWEDDDGEGYTFAPSERITDMINSGLLDPTKAKMEWTVIAESWVEANIKYHEHMGWEPYKPMLQENGEPYPEDVADTVIR